MKQKKNEEPKHNSMLQELKNIISNFNDSDIDWCEQTEESEYQFNSGYNKLATLIDKLENSCG